MYTLYRYVYTNWRWINNITMSENKNNINENKKCQIRGIYRGDSETELASKNSCIIRQKSQ